MSRIDLSPAAIREYAERPDLTDHQCVVIGIEIEFDEELWRRIHEITDTVIRHNNWTPTKEG